MTTTETLRAAATKLREMAEAATPGPWEAEYSGEQGDCVLPPDAQSTREAVAVTRLYASHADALLIATLGPTFAVLVADWLDDTATGEDWLDAQLAPGLMPYVPRLPDWTPLALARHVLEEAS